MINVNLFWYLLLPFALSIATFFILPKLAPDVDNKTAAGFSVGGVFIGALIIAAAFYAGIGSRTGDVEIWNGAVTDKKRVHDSYVRTYQCNCREICSGTGSSRTCTTVCQTCYENHYTVTWSCTSTIGSFIIQHYDTTSSAVYASPDPDRWKIIKKDDPVSRAVSYTNYVKAVPESLFRPAAKDLKAKFAKQIPPYPSNIYDYYKVDRVIAVGVSVPNLREWNDKLSDALKFIGPLKQVNAVIVIVNTADPNYEYALQDAWVGAKKNDVVLLIGAPNYPKIEWVRVISWTERQLFKVRLRDDVLALPAIEVESVIATLKSNIMVHFERKKMRDFQYLEGEIDPPVWVIVTALVLVTISYVGFWAFTGWPKLRGWFCRRRFPKTRDYSKWNGV